MSKQVAIRVVEICCALVIANAPDPIVQAATTSDGKWSLTINETPSASFVAESLILLDQYYHPPLPDVDWSTCCLWAGNYGGTDDFDQDDEDTFNFIRITDDIDALAGPIHFKPGCEGDNCRAIWAFVGDFASQQQLISSFEASINAAALFESSHDPFFLEILWFLKRKFDPGTFPAFIGPYGPESGTPRVWAVALSAAPEPASATICLLALTLQGIALRWRR
jgi:hypothetical protein